MEYFFNQVLNRQAGEVANNWRIFLLSGACLDDNASIIVNMMVQGHYFWPQSPWGKSRFEVWFPFYGLLKHFQSFANFEQLQNRRDKNIKCEFINTLAP